MLYLRRRPTCEAQDLQMKMTQAQVDEHQRRHGFAQPSASTSTALAELLTGIGRPAASKAEPVEAQPTLAAREVEDIHEPLSKYLRDNGIPFVRARSDRQSTIARGWPDFTVCKNGKVLLLEAKT